MSEARYLDKKVRRVHELMLGHIVDGTHVIPSKIVNLNTHFGLRDRVERDLESKKTKGSVCNYKVSGLRVISSTLLISRRLRRKRQL